MNDDRVPEAKQVPCANFAHTRPGWRGRQRGHEIVGPCPVCLQGDDRFSINPNQNIWSLRQCVHPRMKVGPNGNGGGDVIDLVMMCEDCDTGPALTLLVGPGRRRSQGDFASKDSALRTSRQERRGLQNHLNGMTLPQQKRDDNRVPDWKNRIPFYYTDETGAIKYRSLRVPIVDKETHAPILAKNGKPEKEFIRQVEDPASPYGWRAAKREDAIAGVPYGLADLARWTQSMPGVDVYVTEGEAKADLLKSWGLLATSIPKDAQDFGKWFNGAHVIVVPDNDAAGEKYAERVAAGINGAAASIAKFLIPGLPPTGDPIDFARSGGTREKFLELREQHTVPWVPAPPHQPATEKPSQIPAGATIDDLWAYMPQHRYIYAPARDLWPKESVDGRFGRGTAAGLDQTKPVEQMTWAPGEPMIIRDKLMREGGWFPKPGDTVFNLYQPPIIIRGDKNEAGLWIEHVYSVFEHDTDHIVMWLAHRVQRPQEKINHAILLGGDPGIGKDSILEPVKRAVGPWNFAEVSPKQVMGRFNGFLKSVILRVSEARDLGEFDRFQFYEHMKTYIAAPPDVHRIDEKNLREHYIINVNGVIITTNYKADGIFLPENDRRHYVAWSERRKEEFSDDYWARFWRWLEHENGYANVAAYLHELDISSFNPKAPPLQTAAFHEIVNSNRGSEEGELSDVLDGLGWPNALTVSNLRDAAEGTDFWGWLNDRKNRKAIPHKLSRVGYIPVTNEGASDGLWKIGGKRQVVYANKKLSPGERIDAASRLFRGQSDQYSQ